MSAGTTGTPPRVVVVDRVLLLGLMGAGKTTVGRVLAAQLGWPYADNDDLVVEAAGASKETLLERAGVVALREAESAALHLAATHPGPLVAGVAAGAVLDPANVALLAGVDLVVWLRAAHPVLAARVDADPADRPWLSGDTLAAVQRLAAAREPRFAEVADLVVDVDRLSPEQAADLIAAAVSPPRSTWRTLPR